MAAYEEAGALFIQNHSYFEMTNTHIRLTESLCHTMLEAASSFYLGPMGTNITPRGSLSVFKDIIEEALTYIQDQYSNSIICYFCINNTLDLQLRHSFLRPTSK